MIEIMNESALSDDLEMVEQSAAKGQQQIARLRKIKTDPILNGRDRRLAALLLVKFEEIQESRLADRNRLLRQRWHVRPVAIRVIRRSSH